MESLNSFKLGMIKDNSTLSQSKDSYLNAENLRLITLSGQSNFTIENVKGNDFSFIIPDTSAIYRVIAEPSYYASQAPRTYVVTIQGVVYNIASTGTGLQNLVNLINAHTPFTNLGFRAFLSSDSLTIYIVALGPTTITSTPTITSSVGILSGFTYIPAQTNLIPIGFTTVRDDIYIFSTNATTANPGGVDPNLPTDVLSYGQIWKLTYNKSTFVATLTLIYNAQLNFTTQHPIPPTAITGRYETINIQRIYWSDNFNSPRNINVADPNLFALDPTLINNQPNLDLSIPILNRINYNGNLLVGVYQAAYRLSKSGGATTSFSQLSNQVYIVNDVNDDSAIDGGLFKDYISDIIGTNSKKSITWTISNLDTDFDRIELAVVFRETLNGSSTVQIIKDEPINGTTTTITYTGNETDITSISLTELTLSSLNINRVKTLDTKDNRLIYGNIRTTSKLLNTFDTRAYRFDNVGDASITDNGITTPYTGATATSLANTNNYLLETSDAIDLNNAGPSRIYPKPFISAGVKGGTGPNISYEIGVYVISGDDTVNIAAIQTAPYRKTLSPTTTSVNLGITGQDYALNNENEYMGSPYLASIFKSCKRGEIYRWGIQFFDKIGAPLFTKWVGDIKMPELVDPLASTHRFNLDGSVNTDVGAPTDFRTSYIETTGNTCKLQIPFIKFEVRNLNIIENEIGGYSFVRVERKEEDKTILGQGLVHSTYNASAYLGDTFHLYLPNYHQFNDWNIDNVGETTMGTGTMQVPEFLFNGFPGFKSGDILKIVSTNSPSNTIHTTSPDPTAGFTIEKQYSMVPTVADYPLEEAFEVGFAKTIPISTGTFYNYTFDIDGPSGEATTVGSKTLYFKATGFSSILAGRSRYLVEYRRVVSPTDQYGGNTFSDRTNNTYIWAGHFQPTVSNSTTFESDVFGGDIFTNIYDSQRGIKNLNIAISGIPIATGAVGVSTPSKSLTDFARLLSLGDGTYGRLAIMISKSGVAG